MTHSTTRHTRVIQKASPRPVRPGRVERIVTLVALCSIAVLLAVDVVRGTSPDAPVVQATFDVALAADLLPRTGGPDERWSADQSAEGTRPDATH